MRGKLAKSLLVGVAAVIGACSSHTCPSCPTLKPAEAMDCKEKDSSLPLDKGSAAKAPPEVEVERPDRLVLFSTAFSELPGWEEDSLADAIPAFLKSCARLKKRSPQAWLGRDKTGGQVKDWLPACKLAQRLPKGDSQQAREFFEREFLPYLAKNNDDEVGGFTGYYEASLNASRKRFGKYQYPLYKRPKDLVMANMRNFAKNPSKRRIAGKVVGGYLKPYFTRGEIRKGALAGKGLELLWIDDPVDGFFTQIQGSGLAKLRKGGVMRIGYAGQNGHNYTAIGRELVKDGHITREEMSMQAIRKWLADNPSKAGEMMDRNRAFVFFTEVKASGPLGSQGVPLTAERSAAIDRNYIPQSAPLFIDTEVPSAEGSELRKFRQLVIAQDSGGAIRGPVRADIFWGASKEGAEIAGRLKSKGRYFLLLPKTVRPATEQ